MKIKSKLIILIFIIFYLFSCDSSDNPTGFEYPNLNPTSRGQLLEYVKVKTLTRTEILNLLQKSADSFDSEGEGGGLNIFSISYMLQNDVSIYKVFYSSEYDNEALVLSGLVIAPEKDTATAHFQYHHGTLRPYEVEDVGGLLDAPSQFEGKAPSGSKEQIETLLMCLIPASKGYFVSAPDYPGYGISEYKEHPYCYPSALAQTSADMLVAAKELAQETTASLNDLNLLAGISEGGLVSMATHRILDNDYSDIDVTASSNYAGPYNLGGFFRYFITQNTPLKALDLYNWALYTYWKRNKTIFPDSIWTYSVKDQEDALAVPESNLAQSIYTDQFISSVSDKQSSLYKDIEEIAVYKEWNYSGKIYLHHGQSDQTVPVFNTNDAYQYLTQSGANVDRYLYSGDHSSAVIEFFTNTSRDFNQITRTKLLTKEPNKD